MGLEYQGIPSFDRQRDIRLRTINPNTADSFIQSAPEVQPPEDVVFDNLTKLFLKGEELKAAIANMDPAGFVPVEQEASVVASLQRLYPGTSYDSITFGQFQAACDFIAGRSSAFDEDALLSFNVVDPKIAHSKVVTTHKGMSSNGSDWITTFLEGLMPFAGMLIAGKMADLSFLLSPQVDVDSNGGTGSFKSWGAQGSPVAIALLLELGLSVFEYKRLYKNANFPSDISNTFDELCNSPSKREQILTDAGFDYSTFKTNQTFNDHKAIKHYAFNYIKTHQDLLNYDHWISYSHVVDSQLIVRSGASMAPSFSNKWRKYYKLNSPGSADGIDDDPTLSDEVGTFAVNNLLGAYYSNINITINHQYDQIFQALSFSVDPRTVCCLVWLLGPMDTATLKQISDILKITTLRLSANLEDLLSYLSETTTTVLLNLISYYCSVIIDQLAYGLYAKFNGCNTNDVLDADKLCAGFGIVLNLIDISILELAKYLNFIFDELHALTARIANRGGKTAHLTVERRTMGSIIGLLDKLIRELDTANAICNTSDGDVNLLNDTISDKTLDFVAVDLPKMFPVLNMPEDARRKHFSNIKPFVVKGSGIEVPGRGPDGTEEILQNKVSECGENSSALKGIMLGQRLADQLRGII